VGQLILRGLSNKVFPDNSQSNCADGSNEHDGAAEVNQNAIADPTKKDANDANQEDSDRWPNVTHARATQSSPNGAGQQPDETTVTVED
jgi:hypothetical protein